MPPVEHGRPADGEDGVDTPFGRSEEQWAQRCVADGELVLAARYWNGVLQLRSGTHSIGLTVRDGAVAPAGASPAASPAAGVVVLDADADVWRAMLAAEPQPFFNDVAAAQQRGLGRSGDELTYWQYLPAVQRAIELLRADGPAARPTAGHDAGAVPRFDSPVGRYVHVELGGTDHRLYIEEAGAGIPLLLQHTAGSHGAQWRHLFECAEITEHFRLIAYDLPFHGKSIPPVGPSWWERRYELTGPFLRSVPVTLAAVLGLDRPVFMGCSVGGLLALDLALHHPDVFRAVISLEGALRIGGDLGALSGFWHPAVSGETKARMMEGLISPASPAAYRKETAQIYAAGWPPAFLGDLQYYVAEYDLRADAHRIDTSRVGVHILNGEYDYSATPAHGRTAHEAIAGSTFSEMTGLGHFPMSEDPERFLTHLLPLLAQLRAAPSSNS